MLFDSIQFLFFLPVVILIYYLLSPRYRWGLVLFANFTFLFLWRPEWIFLYITIILSSYFTGIWIEKTSNSGDRKLFLYTNIAVNLIVLGFFRYFNLFSDTISYFFERIGFNYDFPVLNILVPIGIAIISLQSMAYSVDVFKGKYKSEKHPGLLAVHLSFFPQLILGPVEKYQSFADKLKKAEWNGFSTLSKGIQNILYGLFLKMVIADKIALHSNQFFDQLQLFNFWIIIIWIVLFSIQIYALFYGIYLIAKGAAYLFEIRLSDNFSSPLFAISITDFVKRWNITIHSWFKEYLVGDAENLNLKTSLKWISIFVLAGLWYAASWKLVLVALFVLIMILGESIFNKLANFSAERSHKLIKLALILKTFLLISVILFFIRLDDLSLFFGESHSAFDYAFSLFNSSLPGPETWVAILVFIMLEIALVGQSFESFCDRIPAYLTWSLCLILLTSIILFSTGDSIEYNYLDFFYE